MPRSFLLLILISASLANVVAFSTAGGGVVEATGNPHIESSGTPEKCNSGASGASGGCVPQITVESVVSLPLATQSDTHMRTLQVKHQGIPLTIYLFKQPSRLSDLELPFKILPLRQLDLTNIFEIIVDPKDALDSWFPGYVWSILVCTTANGSEGQTHIGWKFTGPTDSFYGVIVDYKENEEEVAVGPLSISEIIAEGLSIGMPAPAWMLALMATATPLTK